MGYICAAVGLQASPGKRLFLFTCNCFFMCPKTITSWLCSELARKAQNGIYKGSKLTLFECKLVTLVISHKLSASLTKLVVLYMFRCTENLEI